MDELAKFLTEQWDQRAAKADQIHDRQCDSLEDCCYLPGPCNCGIPASVLADIAAKRRMLTAWPDSMGQWSAEQADAARAMKEQMFAALAAPFADQPGYRQRWRR